jgi:HTH-type transcriptional regulator/antitoxin HigA
MEKQLYEHNPDYATPPGATLKEIIEHLDITERELALRAVLPLNVVSDLIAGATELSPDIAAKLEAATSVPARIWSNLETQFRQRLSTQAERQSQRLKAK